MKILKANLYYFQAYLKAALSFHERLTVIVGDSDHGKSSIIRAIKFLITNRPLRNNYPNNLQEKEKFKIAVTDNTNIVIRSRKDSVNSYSVNGRVEKSFKTEVPDSVKNTLNLSEINVQSQNEYFFLIDKTPGQVSKILNKVAGIQQINESIKNIKSEISSLSSECKIMEKEIKEEKEELKILEWSIQAEKELNVIIEEKKKIDELKSKQSFLEEKISKIKLLRKRLRLLLPDSFSEELESIFSLKTEINSLKNKHSDLRACIARYNKLIKDSNAIVSIDTDTLDSTHRELSDLQKEKLFLERSLSNIKKNQEEIRRIDLVISDTEKELLKFKFCYTCGRIMK